MALRPRRDHDFMIAGFDVASSYHFDMAYSQPDLPIASCRSTLHQLFIRFTLVEPTPRREETGGGCSTFTKRFEGKV